MSANSYAFQLCCSTKQQCSSSAEDVLKIERDKQVFHPAHIMQWFTSSPNFCPCSSKLPLRAWYKRMENMPVLLTHAAPLHSSKNKLPETPKYPKYNSISWKFCKECVSVKNHSFLTTYENLCYWVWHSQLYILKCTEAEKPRTMCIQWNNIYQHQ